MLSNKLTFSLASLVVLLIASLCLPIVAEANIDWAVPVPPAVEVNEDAGIAAVLAGVIPAGSFVVYASGAADADAFEGNIRLQSAVETLDELNKFLGSDWMIEVIVPRDVNLDPKELVISEIGWGLNLSGAADADERTANLFIEFYNASGAEIGTTTPLTGNSITVLFTHFPSALPTDYLNVTAADANAGIVIGDIRASANGKRLNTLGATADDQKKAITADDTHTHVVVDRVTNVTLDALGVTGRYTFPGSNGRLTAPDDQQKFGQVPIVSANRTINYSAAKASDGVPLGHEAASWEATDAFARRNTSSAYVVANPGVGLDPTSYARGAATALPPANTLVINEVRNNSNDDLDWIEVKNVNSPTATDPEIQLEGWEIGLYIGGKKDGAADGEKDIVHFPKYELGPQEILLIVNRDPGETELAGGVNLDILVDANKDQLQKGAQHLYIVRDTLALPNSGDYLLLLRSAKDKNNTDETIQDVVGSLETAGYDNDRAARTEVLPFKNYLKTGDDKVASFGQVDGNHSAWERVPKGVTAGYYVLANTNGRHKDSSKKVTGADTHGIGYDREVDLEFAPGTPGYENMVANTADDYVSTDPDPDGMEIASDLISISEIMYDAGPRWNLIQWIELYNQSMTQSVNLKGWQLEIRNATDEVESYVDSSFIFNDAAILPNQTLLLVSGPGANDVPENRVYNLFEQHRRELGLTQRRSVLLSPGGFYLKLVDKADIDRDSRADQDVVVDEAGNVMVDGASRVVEWELPTRGDVRQSLVRQYGTSKIGGVEAGADTADVGTLEDAWVQSDIRGAGLAYFGHRDDVGTPGYRLGGPLPVSLSSFRPVRDKATGEVVIRWITQSELNNAGFNILRADSKDGEFQVVNLTGIIAGHGTTSEKHVYSYVDKTAKPNVAYYYQIEDVSLNGHRTTLQTTHMRGNVNVAGKLTTTWSDLKLQK